MAPGNQRELPAIGAGPIPTGKEFGTRDDRRCLGLLILSVVQAAGGVGILVGNDVLYPAIRLLCQIDPERKANALGWFLYALDNYGLIEKTIAVNGSFRYRVRQDVYDRVLAGEFGELPLDRFGIVKQTVESESKKPVPKDASEVSHPEDWELAQRAAAGCREAQEQILVNYRRLMMGHAVKLTRNHTVAEDVVQTACIQILRHLHTYRGDAKLASWITRIVRNTVFLRQRREKRRVPVPAVFSALEVDTSHPDPGRVIHARLMLEVVDRVLARNPESAEIFRLRFQEGLTLPEISELTGYSLSKLKSRVHRMRLILERARRRVENLNSSI